MTSPITICKQRRQKLMALMQKGVAIIPTASEKYRNADSHYPFRPDSYFYYLTHFPEPEAILVLIAGEEPQEILFCRPRDEEREIWDGKRFGPTQAKAHFDVDAAYSIEAFEAILAQFLENQSQLFFAWGLCLELDHSVQKALSHVKAKKRQGIQIPDTIIDIRQHLDAMRLIKDPFELTRMRQAAKITSEAHTLAMQASQAGLYEYQLEATLHHHFRQQGANTLPAYTTIVASGANSCILHYVENNQQIQADDLVLIDAGCEYDGYAADITRTFPATGLFSKSQQAIYELVLAAQEAALQSVRPYESHFNEPHLAAVKTIAQGLIDLKICQGTLEEVLETESYKAFYMHRTGHWLGMDVHDVGEYKINQAWQTLQPNMVFTVEPGCYIRPDPNVPETYWNIGVRIEDNILMTETGFDILTDAPKTIAEIQKVMGK